MKKSYFDRKKIVSFIGGSIESLSIGLVFFILLVLGFGSYSLLKLLDPNSPTYSSDSAQLVSAIATIILTFITIITLMINHSTTKENLKLTMIMAESQTEPRIIVEVTHSEKPNGARMVVRNIGSGVARNVRFLDFADIEVSQGRFLSNVAFIKEGITYMPPNQSYETLAAMLKPSDQPMRELRFILSYENAFGRKYEEKIHINLDSIRPFQMIPRIREI